MAQVVDPRGKARHCTLMLLSAGVLADCAPDALQQRTLARYVFLYGDALLLWARRWRNQLRRQGTRVRAPAVDDLAAIIGGLDGVRHVLTAKRQSAEPWRADDIEATAALWDAVSPAHTSALGDAAIRSWHELAREDPADSLLPLIGLSPAILSRCRSALPERSTDCWYVAADTWADLRPFTLPTAQGGEIGRRIAQINDVAVHLDASLRLAPVLYGHPPYDWLVRSALVLELSSLLDLALGPPPGEGRNVLFSLRDLCRRFHASDAADELDRLSESLVAGWDYIRWARNKLAAHIDDELPVGHLHDHLVQLDYAGIARMAEHVLDWLDALGCRLELKLLLLGERPIRSWSTDPGAPAAGRPERPILRGALVPLFRNVDSPFMIGTGSSMGSAVVAGITSGRRPTPRSRITLFARRNHLLHSRGEAIDRQIADGRIGGDRASD